MAIEYQFRCQYNKGSGDCLFLAIEQALRDVRKRKKIDDHVTIRRKVVNFVTKKDFWKEFRGHIIPTHMDTIGLFKTIVDKGLDNITTEDDEAAIDTYKKYMKRKGIYGTFVELFAAGNIYHFNFVIVQELHANPQQATVSIQQIDNTSRWKYFVFSGPYQSGHWENASLLRKRIVYPAGPYIIVEKKDNVLTIKTEHKHGRDIKKRKHDDTLNPKDNSKCSKKNSESITAVLDTPFKKVTDGIHFSPISNEKFISIDIKDDVVTIKTKYKHGSDINKRKHDDTLINPKDNCKCSNKNSESITEVLDMPFKKVADGIYFSPITKEKFILRFDPQARKKCTTSDRKMGLHLIKGSSQVHVLNRKSVIDMKVQKCEININDEYMIYNDSDDITYVCIDILS